MKRFLFRLESLLRFREHLLQQAQQEVARVCSEVLACEERISRFEKDSAETSQELDKEIAAGIDEKRYKHYTDYLKGIESKLESENVHREELLKLLEEKQKHLTQRSVDKKVLENLKNRRREDYYNEMMKTLYKETDDVAILREARGVKP